jgi:hypothetical protein
LRPWSTASLRPARGNIRGDLFAFADTIAFDPRKLLWIGCEVGAGVLNQGQMAAFGNNQLLACYLGTSEVRHFSNRLDLAAGGRPGSATLAARRIDGGGSPPDRPVQRQPPIRAVAPSVLTPAIAGRHCPAVRRCAGSAM